MKGEDIIIYGDGSQTRSFCYVDDLIDGLVKLMKSPDDFVGPVKLGNTVEVSVRELAEVIIKLTGSRSRITFKTISEDDPKQRQLDIALAKEKLAWLPSVNLTEGLNKTVAYFADIIGL